MRLRQEREQRGITLDQITQSTKIGTRFLQALEQDHFEQLPGGIFNKGFVRAYARFVGIDEEQVVADYLTASGADQPEDEEAPAIEPRSEPEGNRAAGVPWGILATILLIIAVSFAVWGFYSRMASTRSQPPAQPEPKQVTPPAEGLPKAESQINSSGPASAAQPAASTTSSSSPTTNAVPSTSETADARNFVLKIRAREDAWISVSVDGEVTTQETLPALSEKTLNGRQQIIVKTGNVGVLDFEFRGKPLPVQGQPGEVKTLAFSATGWHVVPKPAPPPSLQVEPQPAPAQQTAPQLTPATPSEEEPQTATPPQHTEPQPPPTPPPQVELQEL